MATGASMAPLNSNSAGASATGSPQSLQDGGAFSLSERFRPVVLTSPLWLAGIMIFLKAVGGPGVRAVVEFLTFSLAK